jgi:hypothetical protein
MRLASLLLVLAFARSFAQLSYERPGPEPTALNSAAEETDVLEPSRPGPVVADLRARLAVGGKLASLGVEPEVLFLWPSGQGFGVDLGLEVVTDGYSPGMGADASIGLKYAVMRRIGSSPLFYKAGAGASLLLMESGPGLRGRIDGGLSPVAGSRVAFPVEAVFTAEYYGWSGGQVSLGLSAGFGWVFAGR